jgi:bacteriocin leader peptide (microcyclamide/patellamide family)
MDKQNLMPIAAQPVNRITTGLLPAELAELSEEALSQLGEDTSSSAGVQEAGCTVCGCFLGGNDHGRLCSYDGDDAE